MAKNYYSLSIASGSAIGIGFVLPYLWPLSFFGVALFIFIALKASTWKQAILYGYLAGFISWLFVLGVIFWSVLPLDWYGVTSTLLQVSLVILSLLIVVSTVAISFSLVAVAIRFLHTNSWRDVIIFPSLWVISEYIGGFIFYIISLGPGSYFGPHFSIGWVGYLIANDKILLQSAYFGGVFMLSFILVIMATLVFKYLYSTDKQIKIKYFYILITLTTLLAAAHLFINLDTPQKHASDNQSNSKNIVIAAISRQQPPILALTKAQDEFYSQEVYDVVKPLKGVEVLLLPEETSFLDSLEGDNGERVKNTLKEIGIKGTPPTIIDSRSSLGADWQLRSEVSYYTDEENETLGYKQFLVPVGEYLPNVFRFALRLFGWTEISNAIQNVKGYVPGKAGAVATINGKTLATRFCAEVMSPTLYRSDVLNGAEVLINTSSLSWFNGSRTTYEQMKLMAKVRAVESSRWYVQSGNLASAFIINNYGQVVEETTWGEAGSVQRVVPLRTNKTPYTLLGLNIVLIPVFFVLIFTKRPYLSTIRKIFTKE